jgi:hypothetical protein
MPIIASHLFVGEELFMVALIVIIQANPVKPKFNPFALLKKSLPQGSIEKTKPQRLI